MGIDVVYATQTFNANIDGVSVAVHGGTHWPAEDPVVKAHPAAFSSDTRYGMRYSRVPDGYDPETLEPLETAAVGGAARDGGTEQATAAPGEVRNARRPKAA